MSRTERIMNQQISTASKQSEQYLSKEADTQILKQVFTALPISDTPAQLEQLRTFVSA